MQELDFWAPTNSLCRYLDEPPPCTPNNTVVIEFRSKEIIEDVSRLDQAMLGSQGSRVLHNCYKGFQGKEGKGKM